MRRLTARRGVPLLLGVGIGLAGVWVTSWWLLRAEAPKAFIVRVYPAGETARFQEFSIPLAQVICNVAPFQGSPTAVDPVKLEWADKAHPGKVCVWASLNKVLPSPGLYEVTIAAVTPSGTTSEESVRVPFSISQTVDVETPVGVKVYR